LDQSSSHIIIFNKNGEVLVVKRSLNDEWIPGKWAIPGGRREQGETLIQNIQRETKEEVGLKLDPQKIIFLPIVSKRLNHVFFTTNSFSGNIHLGDGEHSHFSWVNPKNLDKNECVPNLDIEIQEACKIINGFRLKIG